MVNPTAIGRRSVVGGTLYKRSAPPPYGSVSLPLVEKFQDNVTRVLDPRYTTNKSIITDEEVAGRGIKNCTHVRITVPVMEPRRFATVSQSISAGPWSDRLVWHCANIEDSRRSQEVALQDSGAASWAPNLDIGAVLSTFGISEPPNKQSGLPPKVVKTIEGVHLSTSAWEFREFPALAKMFTRRGPLAGMVGALRDLGRSRNRSSTLKRLLRAYRDGHLGYSFGLMPTIGDMQSIAREIGRVPMKRARVFNVTTRGHVERSEGKTVVSYNSGYMYDNLYMRQTVTSDRVDGCRVTMRKYLDFGEAGELVASYTNKFIGVNPMALMWEVVPFSFAVDWLLAVDDVLDSLWCNNQDQYELAYWYSVKSVYRRDVSWREYRPLEIYQTRTLLSHQVPPLSVKWSSYRRNRMDPPSPLDMVRAKGANIKNVFLLALIALGFK